jgi:AhpD family alkylhydroperoxidase
MSKLQVYDPAMCCFTGVCGPEVDPALVRFAADLEWLKESGVVVERFNLSQEPAAFVANQEVVAAMRGRDDALPLLLLDGKIVAQGTYPERATLAGLVGVAAPKSLYTEAVAELVAIGAAIASNCEPCFRFHYDKARKLGVSKEDMARAVATAKAVKESPARAVVALAEKYLDTTFATKEGPDACQPQAEKSAAACCPPAEAAPLSLGKPGGAPKKCC